MKQVTDFFLRLFETTDWVPRWQYGKWSLFHGWLYISSNLLIWLCFFTIPFVIIKRIKKKHDPRFIRPSILLTAFIVACGITYLLDSIMFWVPMYRLSTLMRSITAVMSCVALFYIVKYLPGVFSIKSLERLQEEIVQRKKAEAELALSEKRFRSLVQDGGDLVGILDAKGNYQYVSPGTLIILGIEPSEFIGKNAMEYIAEEDKQNVYEAFAKLSASKRVKFPAFRFRHKNGSYLWIETVLTNLQDDPAINGIVFNSRDITDLIVAGHKIAESEKQYAYLIENLPTAFYTCDTEGKILMHNKAAATLWGNQPDLEKNLWNGSWKMFKPDGTPMPDNTTPMALTLKEKRPLPGMEIMVQQPGGNLSYVLSYPSPLYNAAGELTGAMNVLIDITERKNIYARLVKTEMDIRHFAKQQNNLLEDERSRIAREIHDEFGQELAGIKMSLSTLNRFNSMGINTNEIVVGMINEVDNTMQSLRKFATELRPGILDTLGLAASIEWLGEEFENKTGIKCSFDINVQEHFFPKELSTSFFRICQEALTNILKHARATKVSIRISQVRDDLKLVIEDNGIGINTEKLNNPFSMGILGMRERANLLGANLSISGEGRPGTVIHLIAKIHGE